MASRQGQGIASRSFGSAGVVGSTASLSAKAIAFPNALTVRGGGERVKSDWSSRIRKINTAVAIAKPLAARASTEFRRIDLPFRMSISSEDPYAQLHHFYFSRSSTSLAF